ncbi:aldo/keto reductase [Microbacterium sp. AGC85]
MHTRLFGTNGPELSIIGLGCNNFGMRLDAVQSAAVVHAALDTGVTHFDTAEMYGDGLSEDFLGRALAGRRDDVVIATKYLPRPSGEPYTAGALARRIREGCEGSLRRLDTDRIDVFYQHIPDPDAPIDEVLEALDELVRDGKVRHIAQSNVTGAQIDLAAQVAGERSLESFVGVQTQWNLLERDTETELIPAARRHGLGVIPYFPLASGLLTGKYRRNEPLPAGSRLATDGTGPAATSAVFDKLEAYENYAVSRGCSLVELAIGWLLAHPEVRSVIAGATTPDQVRTNAASATWRLSAQELEEISALEHLPAGR